jgi:Tfp pilus assembly protein PilW
MKHHNRRRGMSLMELLIAGFIMSIIGTGIYQMIRASYDSQQRIVDENTVMARGRQAIDDWADQLRGAADITQANSSSITFKNNAGQSIRFWKSGSNILKSVDNVPSAGQTVVQNVNGLSFVYWVWTGTAWTSTNAPTDLTKIGGLHMTTQILIGSAERIIVSDVKIRQRRLTPNP